MAWGGALTCGCGGYARSCRRLPVRFAPKGALGATRLPCRRYPLVASAAGGTGVAVGSSADAERGRGGLALTCGCGGYARSCRRLPVRCAPKGASGANAPPASLLPSSPGGCTVVHPYKRLIANCISDASWSVSTSVGWVSARLSALLYCFEEEVGVLAGDGY